MFSHLKNYLIHMYDINNTSAGRSLALGENLSGGQRQVINTYY